MTTESSDPDSAWAVTAPAAEAFPLLHENVEVDATVVGGGFCGLSTALHLAEAGRSVALLDAHQPGWGASGRNGGQVIPGLKLDPDELVRLHGPDRGERLNDLTGAAPALVYSLIDRLSIACDTRRTGWIQLAVGPRGLSEIQSRAEQWRRRGADVEVLTRDQTVERTGARGYCGGLIDMRGGNLNPLAYARGLAQAAASAGAVIHADSRMTEIRRSGGRWAVKTPQGGTLSNTLLLCTNAYTDGVWNGLAKTVVPFVSGAIATDPLPDEIRASILPAGQAAADNSRLLSWFSLDRDGRLVFGGRTGTWSETTNSTDFEHRVKRMYALFPQIRNLPARYYWSGKVALTSDHVPHLHRLAPNFYAGLGFNGRGVAMSTLMGKLLAEICVEQGTGDTVFPLSPLKTIPMHGLRKPVVQSVVLWKKLMDRINP